MLLDDVEFGVERPADRGHVWIIRELRTGKTLFRIVARADRYYVEVAPVVLRSADDLQVYGRAFEFALVFRRQLAEEQASQRG